MSTSPEVKVTVIVVAAATLYGFYLDIRSGRANDRLMKWLKSERRVEWDELSRSDRFLSMRAIEILRRGALNDDAEFHDRYQQTRPDRRFAAAMIVAVASVALLLIGTKYLGWDW